jgi:hypothetical protein
MKRSLKIALVITAILTISGTGQPLYAQVNNPSSTQTPRTLSTPNPAVPCCNITAIYTSTGVVTAKENATSRTFEFRVTNAALLKSLKVGQGVYANFRAKQVSLDGKTACCQITSGPSAPKPMAPANGSGTGPNSGGGGTGMGSFGQSIHAGTPIPLRFAPPPVPPLARYDQRTVTASDNGQTVSGQIVHIRGLDGIRQALAQGVIPQTVADILAMHLQTLPAGQSNHYMVNPQLALAWSKAHPEPQSLVGAATNDNPQWCGDWWKSAKCSLQDYNDIRAQMQQKWNDLVQDLSRRWGQPAEQFTEQYKTLAKIPVAFNQPNQIRVPLKYSKSEGPYSGQVDGYAAVGFPVSGNFTMDVSVFYVEALPFMTRPRSVEADGSVTTGTTFSAGVTATGTFKQDFPIFSGQYPIEMLPIIAGGVPIAEVDISAYIAADVDVNVTAQVDASYEVDQTHTINFRYGCDGGGCSGTNTQEPTHTTTIKKAEIKGQASITPAVYTALQADFDFDALSLRAGPKPALIGEINGCASFASTTVTGAAPSVQRSQGLMADLDWKTDFIWEALIGGQTVAGNSSAPNALVGRRHILFQDLLPGGSSALMASVTEALNPTMGQPVLFKVQMPQCYPYRDTIQYHVAWTGVAGAPKQSGPSASACTLNYSQSQGTCFGDPTKELDIALDWPSEGAYSFSVVPVHDNHPRDFNVTPNPIGVSVQRARAVNPSVLAQPRSKNP